MATISANGSQSQYNQNVTFIGNGLPQGNKKSQPSLTAEASKINESAIVNQPNNMVAGSNQNTIHGNENNALQGGKPENASKSTPLAAMGTSNAVLGGRRPKKQGCTTPYFVFGGGGITINPPCDCYVSTGIDALEIVSAIFTGGAAAGAMRFFKGAKKLGTLKDATKALSKHLTKLSQIKKNLRAGGPYGETLKRFCQRAMREGGFDMDIELIGAEEINEYASEIIQRINTEKNLYGAMYKEAKDAGFGGKNGYARLLQKRDWQQAMGSLSLFGGLGTASVWLMGALDYLDFEIYRLKDCAAKNRGTLEACQCVCNDDTYTECYDSPALAKIDTLMSPILSFFPILTFGAYSSQDEYVGCDAPCTCLSYREEDAFGNELCRCVCDPPDLDYGNGPCHYQRNFDSDTCCCDCPDGSFVKEGLTLGEYARLSDNLYNPAPSKAHYTYSTGCNGVCDGRDQLADGTFTQFPPACQSGYRFDTDPTVCRCVQCPPPEDRDCVVNGVTIPCGLTAEGYTDTGPCEIACFDSEGQPNGTTCVVQKDCNDVTSQDYIGCCGNTNGGLTIGSCCFGDFVFGGSCDCLCGNN